MKLNHTDLIEQELYRDKELKIQARTFNNMPRRNCAVKLRMKISMQKLFIHCHELELETFSESNIVQCVEDGPVSCEIPNFIASDVSQ